MRRICGAEAPVVTAVAKGSPAERAGIEPAAGCGAGDRLISIAGAPVRDYVDYRFLSAEERVEIVILKPGGARLAITVEKHPDEDLGLDFAGELFDGMRLCRNRCLFCFYDQLPKGLRESLYLRDDDFRLSFLHGNFITLTNLSAADLARICRQRLSPLYVSVHATEPGLRRRILGNPRAPDLLAQMRRLAAGGIEMHAQVVLCPGINDGEALSRTVADLAELHPAVASVAVVPVGLTRHRAGLPDLRPVESAGAARLLKRVYRWQADFLARFGSRFVFAADEIYLLAGEKFPAAAEYEGFPQRENGVGLARLFLDELRPVRRLRPADFRAAAGRPPAAGLRVTLVTGMAARGLVGKLAAKMRRQGVRAQVVAVENRLLGERVTVAGLLAGQDLAAALVGRELGDVVALPASALRDGEFLDGLRVKDLSRRLGTSIVRAAGPKELAAALTRARRRRDRT